MHTVRTRLALTRERSRVVPADHPDAAYLYAVPGTVISDPEARRYDLAAVDGPVETQHVAEPPQTQHVAGPPTTKTGRPRREG